MAVSFKTALGNNGNNVSGTTLVITTTAAIAVGDLVVVRVASDNLSATTPTITCADSGGNTYTRHIGGAVNATAAAGVAGAIFATKATVAVASGGTITATLSGAVAGKAMYAESFTGVENTVRSAAVSATGASTSASAPVSGTANAGDLVIGAIANETRAALTGDSDANQGAWSTAVSRAGGGTSGQDATSVTILGQYKILTQNGAQTYNILSSNAEWWAACVVLQASLEPSITQAAYQFFDDAGTESGAASLAAVNTPVTGDITNGDGIGALRIRLQNTTANAGLVADDYQLQWEKNASGSWTNVTTPEGWTEGHDPSNINDWRGLSTGAYLRNAQSFQGKGHKLSQAQFWLRATVAATTGTLRAYLYTHTGTFGSTGLPSGGALIASTTAINISTVSTTAGWVNFDFDGSYTLESGTPYFISVEATSPGNLVEVYESDQGAANPKANHYGNQAIYVSSWILPATDVDTIFRLYTVPLVAPTTAVAYDNPNLTGGAVTTNRLGAGTGSFQAGEVCEDGNVNDIALNASAYTELLYSLKIIAAQVANGDTLRFRVLYNGATTKMTYTQTPTVNIVRSAANVAATITTSWGGWTGTAAGTIVSGAANVAATITTVWGGDPQLPVTAGLVGHYSAADASTFSYSSSVLVSEWRDKSGLDRHFAQVTVGFQPQRSGTQNGRSTVVFQGVDDYMDTGPFTVSQPITVFLALDPTADQFQGWFSSVGGSLQVWVASPYLSYYAGNVVSGPGVSPGPQQWTITFDGSSSSMRRNGTQVSTGNPGTTGTTTGFRLAERNLTTDYFPAAAYFEILAYDRVLSAPEVVDVESYIDAMWFTPGVSGDGWIAAADGTITAPSGPTDWPATVTTNWGPWTATAAGTVVAEVISGTIADNWGTWNATSTAVPLHPATSVQTWGTWTGTAAALILRYGTITTSWGSWTASAAGVPNTPVGWSIPPNVVATSTGSTTITVTWDAVPAATGYDIERNSAVIVLNHPASPYNDTGLNSDTQYNYRVRAVG